VRIVLPEDIWPDTIRPLRRVEYRFLVDDGAFLGERLELLNGEMFKKRPRQYVHSYVSQRLLEILLPALLGRASVRPSAPLAASDISELEPDIAVVPLGTYANDAPSAGYLVVEVPPISNELLAVKTTLYAEMGVPDFWVIDVTRRELVVHRAPVLGRYETVRTVGDGESVELAAFPHVVVPFDDVLPPGG
jgi:Uma2 family endonuclease